MKQIKLDDLPSTFVSHHEKITKQVIVKNGDVPHLAQLAQATLRQGQKVEEHAHQDMTEIFFVKQGLGRITVDSKEYALETGVCIVVEPKEKHSLVCLSEEPLVLLYFGVVK